MNIIMYLKMMKKDRRANIEISIKFQEEEGNYGNYVEAILFTAKTKELKLS